MLEYKINKGEIEEFSFGGTLPELAADISTMIGYMHEKIKESDPKQGELFQNMTIHAIAVSFAMNLVKDKKKEEEPNDELAKEFMKFLHGDEEDGEDDN